MIMNNKMMMSNIECITDKNYLQESIKQIHQIVREQLGDQVTGGCLHHAVLAKINLGAEIEAGTSSWQFSADYGRNPTHFTYQYERGSKLSPLKYLPEIHIWNVLNGQILDLSTLYFPRHCLQMIGYRWEKDLIPPVYFMGPRVDPMGKRWAYMADDEATALALQCASDVFGDSILMRS